MCQKLLKLTDFWLSYFNNKVDVFWDTVIQPFYGPLSGSTRVSRYQKKHSSTHTYREHQSCVVCFLHLLRSMASSLFNLRARQSAQPLSKSSLVYLLVWHPPLHSCSIQFFTQSLYHPWLQMNTNPGPISEGAIHQYLMFMLPPASIFHLLIWRITPIRKLRQQFSDVRRVYWPSEKTWTSEYISIIKNVDLLVVKTAAIPVAENYEFRSPSSVESRYADVCSLTLAVAIKSTTTTFSLRQQQQQVLKVIWEKCVAPRRIKRVANYWERTALTCWQWNLGRC